MAKYTKGKFPYTILDVESGKLYVRKSITLNKFARSPKTGRVKFYRQKQIWRLCEPATIERALEILFEIEAGIFCENYRYSKGEKDEVIFSKVEKIFRRGLNKN